jgi:hypothetical protein
VAAAGVNVRMISQGASEINITFVIQEEDVPAAVRSLHSDLFADARAEGGWRWLPSGDRREPPASEHPLRLRAEES